MAISNDDKRLISGGGDNFIIIWNLESRSEVKKLTGHTSNYFIEITF